MTNIRRPSTSSRIRRRRCGSGHTQHTTRRIPHSSNTSSTAWMSHSSTPVWASPRP